ncbi:MAG: xanthine phosphoribosyltransferase [Oscillospiraceae bacterium]|nr:xanthine phosphoribosyltransferase [Oscillospiraceae bacterium]
MELLKKTILEKGIVLSDSILKVDSFINHQVNPVLMREIGKEFKKLFSHVKITKVLTAESSGIAPALMTALEFGVDLIFARKRQSLTLKDDLLTAEVFSFTKQEVTTLTVSRQHIDRSDVVLLIDDFLANGEVAGGLVKVSEQVGAKIAGFGFVIEKTFQKGRAMLEKTGIAIESLARISSLANGKITFID